MKGDDGKISGHIAESDDAQHLSLAEQAATPDDTTQGSDDSSRMGFPRSLRSLELNDVGMSDLGFEALIRWLQSLHDKSEVENSEEERISHLHLRFVRRILFLLDFMVIELEIE
jgi:hypothetical protein